MLFFTSVFSIHIWNSLSFSFGNKNFFIPFLIPEDIFISNPPIAVISPLNVISPVIATSFFIFLLFNKLYIATVIATPADGPSFEIAPSGQ